MHGYVWSCCSLDHLLQYIRAVCILLFRYMRCSVYLSVAATSNLEVPEVQDLELSTYISLTILHFLTLVKGKCLYLFAFTSTQQTSKSTLSQMKQLSLEFRIKYANPEIIRVLLSAAILNPEMEICGFQNPGSVFYCKLDVSVHQKKLDTRILL